MKETRLSVENKMRGEWAVFAASLLIALLILLFGRHGGDLFRAAPAYMDGVEALLPHRAVYAVKMVSVRSGSQLINVSGQLTYEWQPACGGVVSDYHFDMRYDYSDAPSMAVESHVANFEPYDRPQLDFVTQRFNAGQLFQSISGRADLDKGTVAYSAPLPEEDALPAGSYFPTAFTLRVLQAIKAGDRRAALSLFDGSDDQGAGWVNVLIGSAAVDDAAALAALPEAVDRSALQSGARRVRMAFFPEARGDILPEYEMDAIFQENGVMRSVQIEYDDFSIVQELVSLDILEGQCE